MKCRHCLVAFHPNWNRAQLGSDADRGHAIAHTICPACERINVAHLQGDSIKGVLTYATRTTFVYPFSVSREPLDASVPKSFANDYKEACDILALSPKASAALGRRILQHVLHDCAKIKERTLDAEITKALDEKLYPVHIADALDAVRTIGNFAAHPIKSSSTGEIVDVVDGEAEWTLDTVEALFEHHFVQPAKTKAKRDALNAKLADAKKPALK